jgi:hypothetical protein
LRGAHDSNYALAKAQGEQALQEIAGHSSRKDEAQQTHLRILKSARAGDHYREWKRRRRQSGQDQHYRGAALDAALQNFEALRAHHFRQAFLAAFPAYQIEQRDSANRSSRGGQYIHRQALGVFRGKSYQEQIIPYGKHQK